MFFSQYLGFSLSVSLRQCSILIFIYVLLIAGKMGEAREPPKDQTDIGELTYLVTPCSTVLEKLTGLQLVKKLRTFYSVGTGRSCSA